MVDVAINNRWNNSVRIFPSVSPFVDENSSADPIDYPRSPLGYAFRKASARYPSHAFRRNDN